MIEAAVSIGVVAVGAVVWLVRLENKSNTACNDAQEAKTNTEKILEKISDMNGKINKISGYIEGREVHKK